jgi:hypothetical protein
MWKSLSIAMLCCWCVPAWALDPWCGVRNSSAYSFEWLPDSEADTRVGSVRIKDAAGAVVQVLDKLENYHASSEMLGTSRDFNGDGCADLVVTNSVAGIGNESLSVFLYQPQRGRFVLDEALSAIGGLDVDPRDKRCVTGFWKGGAADIHTERHCWRKGKLVMVQEYSVSPLYNEEGALRCYEHVTIDYRGGKKRKRRECTKEL